MRDLVVLFIHFIATLARFLRPGGARSIVAESLLLKHQLVILNRSRQRAPNLSTSDRILAGWLALWLRPTRLLRSASCPRIAEQITLAFNLAIDKDVVRRILPITTGRDRARAGLPG